MILPPPPNIPKIILKEEDLEKDFSLKRGAPGDHIKASRIGYSHHGIYLGDEGVIHYLDGRVSITDYEEFRNGDSVKLVIHKKPKYTPKEAIERAYSRLGEKEYDLVFNNCEHFCNWCIEGVSKSKQVKNAAGAVAITGGGGAAVAASVAASAIPKIIDDASKTSLDDPVDAVATIASSVVENVLDAALDTVDTVVKDAIDAVCTPIDDAIDTVSDVFNWFFDD